MPLRRFDSYRDSLFVSSSVEAVVAHWLAGVFLREAETGGDWWPVPLGTTSVLLMHTKLTRHVGRISGRFLLLLSATSPTSGGPPSSGRSLSLRGFFAEPLFYHVLFLSVFCPHPFEDISCPRPFFFFPPKHYSIIYTVSPLSGISQDLDGCLATAGAVPDVAWILTKSIPSVPEIKRADFLLGGPLFEAIVPRLIGRVLV